MPRCDLAARGAGVVAENGTAASQMVEIGTTIAVTTSPIGMTVLVYDGHGCVGTATGSHASPWSATFNEHHEGSFRAYDLNDPDQRTSCLDATWRQAEVGLLLNGVAAPANVTLDAVVTATTSPPGMQIGRFFGHDCNPANETGEWTGTYHEISPTPLQVSFRATDPALGMNASPCLNASWAPAPIELFLNGQASSLMVRENTQVLVQTSPAGMFVNIYSQPDCILGSFQRGQGEGFYLNSLGVDHISVQAVNPQYPDFPSPCLNITWNSGLLPLLNGQANDLRVAVDNQVAVATMPNVPVRIVSYTSHDCLPANQRDSQQTSSLTLSSSTARNMSVRAFHDDSQVEDYDPSPCRNLTWELLDIRLRVNDRASGTVIPYPVTTWYGNPSVLVSFWAPNDPARNIAVAIYPSQDCTGTPARIEGPNPDNNPTNAVLLHRADVLPRVMFWAIQAYDVDHPAIRGTCIIVDWTTRTQEPFGPGETVGSPEPNEPTVTPDPSSTVSPAPDSPTATSTADQQPGSAVTSLPATGDGTSQTLPVAPIWIGAMLLLSSILAFLALRVNLRRT